MTPVLATALAALYLPVPLIMLWLHGPRRLWRRWGATSYALHTVVYLALVGAVIAAHRVWSAGALAPPIGIRLAGAAFVVAAATLLALTYRDIDTATAMAVPQLVAPGRRRLITGGVYRVIRHPRYAVLILAALGNLLIVGSPGLLVACLATIALTMVLVRVEEAELLESFGDAYRHYAADVPGIIPRFYRKR